MLADDLPGDGQSTLRVRPDIDHRTIRGSSGFAIATEAIGRVSVVVALVLFVLVMLAIDKGLAVQDSARQVVNNFHTANDYFDERADLTAPATARRQLEELQGVLTELNRSAAVDVTNLAALVPTMQKLLAAGQGDQQIAATLDGIAASLRESAGSLKSISAKANTAVNGVNEQLVAAIDLVDQLNNELSRTTRKLAPIPAQDGLIPAPQQPGGN
ncbi:hypothetical protein [Gordonia sp. OPL2]|uniref:hypothetical protein n=1 Tax=Gordonia sp. OPL2 TaxID=2486274 RepID=UPI0021CC73F7|nr:hypothetical protein [Gordonia sp. OPL2]